VLEPRLERAQCRGVPLDLVPIGSANPPVGAGEIRSGVFPTTGRAGLLAGSALAGWAIVTRATTTAKELT